MPYIYNDEDNVPMNENPYDIGGHNPTVYNSRAEERAIESGLPFTDPGPDDGCWNCMNFDWNREACTLNWNNMDESYYNPDIDDRELTDWCEYHDTDPDVDPDDVFGGDD